MDTLYERLKEEDVDGRLARTANEIVITLANKPKGCILPDIIDDLEYRNTEVFKHYRKIIQLLMINTLELLIVRNLVVMDKDGRYRLTEAGRMYYVF